MTQPAIEGVIFRTQRYNNPFLVVGLMTHDCVGIDLGLGICHCSATQLRLTLCNPMDCSTPGFPVLHHLLEFAQIHVH